MAIFVRFLQPRPRDRHDDPLCVCGQRASHHDAPEGGDTRCLAVEAREDPIEAFGNGRDTAYAYCACLRI